MAIAGSALSQKKVNGAEYDDPVRVDSEVGFTSPGLPNDVFGQEDNHDIKYKTLSWPLTAVL